MIEGLALLPQPSPRIYGVRIAKVFWTLTRCNLAQDQEPIIGVLLLQKDGP